MNVRRGFVDVPDGQIHYRESGRDEGGLPLIMLHSNPGSSAMLLPLLDRFGRHRRVVAPDTLGFGDSTPSRLAEPSIPDYAAATLCALDGLGIERFDLYGSHTGANMAVEMAIARPDRVNRMVLDGIALYTAAERADYLENYAPPVLPDAEGRHLLWTWHFVRDQWLFWPWFKRDKAHRRELDLPDPTYLNAVVLDVLKSLGSFRLGYRASFSYEKETRLPLLRTPTLVASAESDIFFPQLAEVAALVPDAETLVVGGESEVEREEATRRFLAFYETGRAG